MTRSTVFTTNRSQAVRLPKPVALPEGVRHVEIVKFGRSRLISPEGQSWDAFFGGPGPATISWTSGRRRRRRCLSCCDVVVMPDFDVGIRVIRDRPVGLHSR